VASAQIRIDQAANAVPLGTAGIARDDIDIDAAVTLRNGDPAGVKRSSWTLLDRPYASSAVISNPTSAVATIVPDTYGEYRVRLEINGGGPGEYDIRCFSVRDPAGMALPALGVRGGKPALAGQSAVPGENNYLISPGVYNTAGWQREMNERQLRSLDNRDDPTAVYVPGGGENFTYIVWGLPMGILQSLEILADVSVDSDFSLYADAAGTIEIARWPGIDASVGWHMFSPVTCTGHYGAGLEDDTIYLKIRNNGVPDSDYTVYYRIKAP